LKRDAKKQKEGRLKLLALSLQIVAAPPIVVTTTRAAASSNDPVELTTQGDSNNETAEPPSPSKRSRNDVGLN
jgi:hypothetical protein